MYIDTGTVIQRRVMLSQQAAQRVNFLLSHFDRFL